jgi:putative ABC transport system permease protein
MLGGLGVANTMIMSVFTRIREIAILRVNGFSNLADRHHDLWRVRGRVLAGRAFGCGRHLPALHALKQIPALARLRST